MAYIPSYATLGTNDTGVKLVKNLYLPVMGVARASGSTGVGDTVPVVFPVSQVCEFSVTVSNVAAATGSTSVWLIPSPQGSWTLVDSYAVKLGSTGGTNDKITIKKEKNGTLSSTITSFSLDSVADESIVRATTLSNASSVNTFDSAGGDKIAIAALKTTTDCSADVYFKFVLA